MRHMFTIFPDDFEQKRVFLRQPARQETLPMTSKMSRIARDPLATDTAQKWALNPQI